MAEWRWVKFDGAKPHMVPLDLYDDIVRDLESRGCPLSEAKTSDRMTIDMPGMVCVDRPWEEFDLDGLRLEVPSEDVSMFLSLCRGLSERVTHTGRSYRKLHGFLRCLVLTPAQLEELTELLGVREYEAEARAAAFYATRRTPAQVLRDAQPGMPPELAPDRHARFTAEMRAAEPDDDLKN